MYKIFLSYAREDRAAAEKIIHRLRLKLPNTISFLDFDDTPAPGENWVASMTERLASADAVIVIMSRAAERSQWVQAEVAWALGQRDGRLPIFPALIGPHESVPDLLRSLMYVDLTDGNFDHGLDHLAQAIVYRLISNRPANVAPEVGRSNDEGRFLDYSVGNDLIESQLRILKFQERVEHEHVVARSRVLYGLVALVVLLSTAAASLIILFSVKSGYQVVGAVTAVSAPLVGIFGTVIGFYFGKASKDSATFDNRHTRDDHRSSPWSR